MKKNYYKGKSIKEVKQMELDYGIERYKKSIGEDSNQIGRVIGVYSYLYTVATKDNIYKNVELSGNCKKNLLLSYRNVAIGDFVCVKQKDSKTIINQILPEFNKISKNTSSKETKEQILAANIDNVFITIACDQHFSIGMLERYLFSFSDNRFHIKILLTKADLQEQLMMISHMIEEVYPDLELTPVSVFCEEMLQFFYREISPSSTSVFIGSSGSGKSTLINALIEDNIQKTRDVNKKNAKGKHTTTNSIILPMKSEIGGYLIDTPGIKSISVWNESDSKIFSDIDYLMTQCKFSSCSHSTKQSGCAIQQAIQLGILDEERYKRYLSLNRELERRKQMSYSESKKRNNAIKDRQMRQRNSKKR